MNNNIGSWLQQQRTDLGLSQAELARRSGLNRAVICKIENGRTSPKPETLQAIARALKIPPEDAFRNAGLLPPKPERTPANAQLDYLFNQLSPYDQATVLDIVQAFIKRNEHKTRVPQTAAIKNMG